MGIFSRLTSSAQSEKQKFESVLLRIANNPDWTDRQRLIAQFPQLSSQDAAILQEHLIELALCTISLRMFSETMLGLRNNSAKNASVAGINAALVTLGQQRGMNKGEIVQWASGMGDCSDELLKSLDCVVLPKDWLEQYYLQAKVVRDFFLGRFFGGSQNLAPVLDALIKAMLVCYFEAVHSEAPEVAAQRIYEPSVTQLGDDYVFAKPDSQAARSLLPAHVAAVVDKIDSSQYKVEFVSENNQVLISQICYIGNDTQLVVPHIIDSGYNDMIALCGTFAGNQTLETIDASALRFNEHSSIAPPLFADCGSLHTLILGYGGEYRLGDIENCPELRRIVLSDFKKKDSVTFKSLDQLPKNCPRLEGIFNREGELVRNKGKLQTPLLG